MHLKTSQVNEDQLKKKIKKTTQENENKMKKKNKKKKKRINYFQMTKFHTPSLHMKKNLSTAVENKTYL